MYNDFDINKHCDKMIIKKINLHLQNKKFSIFVYLYYIFNYSFLFFFFDPLTYSVINNITLLRSQNGFLKLFKKNFS